jgi:hypothetical protein
MFCYILLSLHACTDSGGHCSAPTTTTTSDNNAATAAAAAAVVVVALVPVQKLCGTMGVGGAISDFRDPTKTPIDAVKPLLPPVRSESCLNWTVEKKTVVCIQYAFSV